MSIRSPNNATINTFYTFIAFMWYVSKIETACWLIRMEIYTQVDHRGSMLLSRVVYMNREIHYSFRGKMIYVAHISTVNKHWQSCIRYMYHNVFCAFNKNNISSRVQVRNVTIQENEKIILLHRHIDSEITVYWVLCDEYSIVPAHIHF